MHPYIYIHLKKNPGILGHLGGMWPMLGHLGNNLIYEYHFFTNAEKPSVFTVNMSLHILLSGASWEHLEASWGHLGSIWGSKDASKINAPTGVETGMSKSTYSGPPHRPTSTKIGSKILQNLPQIRLLGGFWADHEKC